MNNRDAVNWAGLDKFLVGRPDNKYRLPIFKRIFAIYAILYLLFGLALFIGIKIFSSRPKAYKFAQVVFRWPKMFRELVRFLRSTK